MKCYASSENSKKELRRLLVLLYSKAFFPDLIKLSMQPAACFPMFYIVSGLG